MTPILWLEPGSSKTDKPSQTSLLWCKPSLSSDLTWSLTPFLFLIIFLFIHSSSPHSWGHLIASYRLSNSPIFKIQL